MKNKVLPAFIFILFFFLSVREIQAVKQTEKELSEYYKKWREEEVIYIITPKEKDVFLQLKTYRERDLFIEAFWKHRDPNPNTAENEFKKEHYRRIAYANRWFGRESPLPGWKTDMGRIYIILGEPNSIEKFENLSEVYPIIIWFYQGKIDYGLPNSFNVVFFKRSGMGEYELYSPVKFGPQYLLIHYKGDQTDYRSAFYELLEIEPVIAQVSLTLLPEETTHRALFPSLASEVLIFNKIPSAPHKKIEDSYAEKLLRYKDIVEVEYTANYIENDSSVSVIRDKSGIFFVHFIIEPKKLTFEKYENKFHTRLEINGLISDTEGNAILQYQRTIPIEFNEGQFNNIKGKLFSFQDMFPLIEGNYELNLLLKNNVSKEFTSVEAKIAIPKESSLYISSLVLANKINKDSKYRGKNKPFLFGDIQLVPSPRNDFSIEDNLYLFFQILGLDKDLKENGVLEYSIYKDDEKVHSIVKNIKSYPNTINLLEEFSLEYFVPAYYILKVSLLNRNREEILSEQTHFFISPLASLPRPWILSVPMASSNNPLYLNILGKQHLNKKEIEKAKFFLEKAYGKNPHSPQFALDFCRVLFILKEYHRVKEIAVPFLIDQKKYKFLLILGQTFQATGEFKNAISYYRDYLSHFGTNLNILNAIGECYFKLGKIAEALEAWEKSLEIDSNQEEIQRKVVNLKGKK